MTDPQPRRPDRILIRDLRLQAIIGIHDHERTSPQELVINIELDADVRDAAAADDIDQTVNYHAVAMRVAGHVNATQRLTLEALATDIARICCAFERVQHVRVRLEKPAAVEEAAAVGVEIERTPADFA